MDSPNPFHTPNNTRKHSHFGTSSSLASSTSPIEPDSISPRHPSDVYLTANTPLLVAAVIEKLKKLDIDSSDMATPLTTAEIQDLAEKAAKACSDHGAILKDISGAISSELRKGLEHMQINLPRATSVPKLSDLKVPPIITIAGKIDIFSLLAFESDIQNLITAIDPDNKIDAKRWNQYILASIHDANVKKALIGIKPEDYQSVKTFLVALREKCSGSDVRITSRALFRQCVMGTDDPNTFMAKCQYLQTIGWELADRSESDLVNQILMGVPDEWRNETIKHLGTLPATFEECRRMILRVKGEFALMKTMSEGVRPVAGAGESTTLASSSNPNLPSSGPGPMEIGAFERGGRGYPQRGRGRSYSRGGNSRGRYRQRSRGRSSFRGRGGRGRGSDDQQRGASRGRRGNSQRRGGRKSVVKCWNCDTWGHVQRDCKEPPRETLYHQHLDWVDSYNEDEYDYDDDYGGPNDHTDHQEETANTKN